MTRTVVGLLAIAFGSLGLATLASAEGEAASSARGEQLFALCTQCHGTAGEGNRDALAPAIAGLPAWYLEAQLNKFRAGIRGLHAEDTGGLRMYPMSQWLRTDEDAKAVAGYVASLPATNPAPALEAHGDAGRGAGYYAVCSACHMPNGSGNQGMGAPPLVGMNDWYLLESIRKYKASIRGSNPRDNLGQAMIGMVATLPSDEAILDVIAHIQSLDK
ncbi:MAG: cytochrome c [Spirochaetaceae bacterium]|nr:cytochrome c [Spirochaetaceae bacterium]